MGPRPVRPKRSTRAGGPCYEGTLAPWPLKMLHPKPHKTKPQSPRRLFLTELAFPYIGQWNRLPSTTNWEKGRIICQWREAMIDGGAPITEYSDEAWAQLVGGVTSQHAGRLRRVYQHFGEVWDQYEGLYWSHFQAALDWEDAEMWLEGSLQNDWSVSQMRGKRWETLGTPPEDQQAAASLEATEADAEANTEANTDADAEDSESATDIAAASAAKDAGDPANPSTTTAVKPRGGRF